MPSHEQGAADGWRAVTRVLRSCCGRAAVTFRGVFRDVVTAWFPYECQGCWNPLNEVSRVPLCRDCVEGEGKGSEEDLCRRCGEALGWESARERDAAGVLECRSCRWSPPEFDRAVSAAAYEGSTREILHLLKYSGMRETAQHVLGVRLARAIAQFRPEAAGDLLVVPVPLHASRLSERGFNQADVLARAALAELRRSDRGWGLKLESTLLERVRDGRRFFGLDPAARRRQIRGAFRLRDQKQAKHRLQGREVLLIDDILTTGATARECARVLKAAGAARVWVATVARAQPAGLSRKGAREGDEAGLPADVARWDAAPVSPAG